MRLFPDAKRRNDVEERSTLKRRRLLLETCDRPEASAPLPRHASRSCISDVLPPQRFSRQPDPHPPAVPGAPPPAGTDLAPRARGQAPAGEAQDAGARRGAPRAGAPRRTTGTGKLEWSVSREGANEGAAAGRASTAHTTRPEEPQQHTPTWPSWISHTASQHPTGPRGEPGQRNGWTLAPGDWPKESALREHRSMKLRSASCKCNGRCADPTPIRSLPASHNQPCSIFR